MGYDMYLEEVDETRPEGGYEEWKDWFDGVNDAGGYFRLNIWGMREYRDLMHELDMIEAAPPPPDVAGYAEIQPFEKPTGIPVYKLCSNDGWLVTPAECQAALLRYFEGGSKGNRLDTVKRHLGEGKTDDYDPVDYWNSWLAFLMKASQGGGFRVY